MNNLQIGKLKASPGEFVSGEIDVAGTDTSLRVIIATGKQAGPVGFITGGMHGDEINGPALVTKVKENIDIDNLKGTLIFLPVLNPSGLLNSTRRAPEDDIDLNRAFGHSSANSHSYKVAETLLKEVIQKCSFGIDCHDAGGTTALVPHTRVHIDSSGVCTDGCTLDLGKVFGTKIVLQREGNEGMLAIESWRRFDMPVVTVELGGGLKFWDTFLEEGLKGILNILIEFDCIEGQQKRNEQQFIITDEHRKMYKAQSDHLISLKVQLNDFVHAGDTIAHAIDPFSGKKHKYTAENCGFVFSVSTKDIVIKGAQIVSILQTESCTNHNTQPLKRLN